MQLRDAAEMLGVHYQTAYAWVRQGVRLHAAIMSGDETMARHVFDRLAQGVPLTDLCERIIAPALQRVGDDWASGAVSIGAEHRASAICERLLAAPPSRRAARAASRW